MVAKVIWYDLISFDLIFGHQFLKYWSRFQYEISTVGY